MSVTGLRGHAMEDSSKCCILRKTDLKDIDSTLPTNSIICNMN